jgi:ribonuclease E
VIVHHDPVAKHRSAPSSNQGRRSRGSSSQQSNQPAAPAQQAPAGGGTHSITEGAKSALAVIAASTIVPATGEHPTDAADVPTVPAATERPKKSRKKRGGEWKGPRSDAEQLLDSVLDALPEPKAPGHGRNRRRVTTAMLTASPAAINDSSDPVPGPNSQS